MSVEFRYGDINSDYPVHDKHNTMIGIAGDLSQNEFEQFYYHHFFYKYFQYLMDSKLQYKFRIFVRI